jgi:hypothetical protein
MQGELTLGASVPLSFSAVLFSGMKINMRKGTSVIKCKSPITRRL